MTLFPAIFLFCIALAVWLEQRQHRQFTREAEEWRSGQDL